MIVLSHYDEFSELQKSVKKQQSIKDQKTFVKLDSIRRVKHKESKSRNDWPDISTVVLNSDATQVLNTQMFSKETLSATFTND